MNRARWIWIAASVVAVGQVIDCGGDDSNFTVPAGSTGSAGSAGKVGASSGSAGAGTAGYAGSTGTANGRYGARRVVPAPEVERRQLVQ